MARYSCEDSSIDEEDFSDSQSARSRESRHPSDNKNDFHLSGTSLGGWLVLEPWLTPSLFYQFLGQTNFYGSSAKNHIAIDSYTFCTSLGATEANNQLRRHWKHWVTEESIRNLSIMGVQTVRIPIADWMYKPYYPYIGCWDGALDELNRGIRLCEKYGMKVLLDVHAMRYSQNGLDNSGDTSSYEWLSTTEKKGFGLISNYRHWDIRGGNWIGPYNTTSHSYGKINVSNIMESVEVIKEIVQTHKFDFNIIGIEPVNEPWWFIPLDILKEFYWLSYNIIQREAPHWITLMHDSFRLSPGAWAGNWMKGCSNWAMDTHIYQAWSEPGNIYTYIENTCAMAYNIILMESLGVPIIVGEWSLATDNCALWINGLNDNVPGYPKVKCDFVKCPIPDNYETDKRKDSWWKGENTLDPQGNGGKSYIINGTCPRGRPFDNEDYDMNILAKAKLYVFDTLTHGQFFWNFRTEYEPRWDYQQAVQKGWIPKYSRKEMTTLASRTCLHSRNATKSVKLSIQRRAEEYVSMKTISTHSKSNHIRRVEQFQQQILFFAVLVGAILSLIILRKIHKP